MSEEEGETVSSKFDEISKKLISINKVVKSILEKMEQKNNYVKETG